MVKFIYGVEKMNVYVIIDMQNDFIDGALKNEDAMKIVEGTARNMGVTIKE